MTDRWAVILTPTARRDVRRLDREIKRRVEHALDELSADPAAARLRKLKGRPESRLRIGDWRVLLELDHQARTIVVHHILPRGRAYDR
ncbi:MAG: type II toxin-antitoxin system RelE family toxin [Trebonia sp.]